MEGDDKFKFVFYFKLLKGKKFMFIIFDGWGEQILDEFNVIYCV